VIPGFIDAETNLLTRPEESHITAALEFAGRMLARGTTAIGLSVGGSADPKAEGVMLAAAGSLGARAPSTVAITWRAATSDVARLVGPAAARVAGFAGITCPGEERAGAIAKDLAPLKTRLRTCDHPACRCWHGFEPVTAGGRKMLGSPAIPLLRPAGADRFASDIVNRIESEGRAVALASDSSIDSVRIEGMPFMVDAAVDCAGMPFELALWAATRGGALAIGDSERGRLRLGSHADVLVLEGSEPSAILERPDGDPAAAIVLGGTIVPR